MKCDKLKAEQWLDYSGEPMPCYPKAKVDEAIAELKAENAELKKKCETEKSIGATFSKNGADLARWVEELRKEIESLKSSHYAEMVDAVMRERRLKRELWIARAERAKEKQQLFHFSLGYEKLCIDGFYDPYSGRRELSPKQWIKAFNKVEVKLLKKAEKFKETK